LARDPGMVRGAPRSLPAGENESLDDPELNRVASK
jgi:hypothetical protein